MKQFYVRMENNCRSILCSGGDTVGPVTAEQKDWLVKNYPRWAVNRGDYFPKVYVVQHPPVGDLVLTLDEWLKYQSPTVKAECPV